MPSKSLAALLAFAALLAASSGANAKAYQKSKTFVCAPIGFQSICKATFPKIKSGQRLTITYVSCVIGTSNVGQEVITSVSAVGASPVFPGNIISAKPRHYLIWQSLDAANQNSVVSVALPFDIKAGTSPEVALFLGNNHPLIGTCTISGKLVKS